MIIAKVIGTSWMLMWFVIVLRSLVSGVVGGKDPFGYLMASILVWIIVAIGPIAIIKFGWSYIGRA